MMEYKIVLKSIDIIAKKYYLNSSKKDERQKQYKGDTKNVYVWVL